MSSPMMKSTFGLLEPPFLLDEPFLLVFVFLAIVISSLTRLKLPPGPDASPARSSFRERPLALPDDRARPIQPHAVVPVLRDRQHVRGRRFTAELDRDGVVLRFLRRHVVERVRVLFVPIE